MTVKIDEVQPNIFPHVHDLDARDAGLHVEVFLDVKIEGKHTPVTVKLSYEQASDLAILLSRSGSPPVGYATAWIGIVPREDLTGGKHSRADLETRRPISGRILVVGAHAERARHQPEKYPWVTRLLERKPFRVVAVAVANKMARVARALLARGGSYRAPAFAAAA